MHLSWGRYPKIASQKIWMFQPDHTPWPSKNCVLPYGQGRSYGDSCLNDEGLILTTRFLNQWIHFDKTAGILRCEAGMTFSEILNLIVPNGWFLPVTPGTKFVSLGGAIANDIHGKNHHRAGTLGCHINCFELLRSTGERFICSPTENTDLFSATIGGLGLTGVITWAEIRLKSISNPFLSVENIAFDNIESLLDKLQQTETHEYLVAWLDIQRDGRGILTRANHDQSIAIASSASSHQKQCLSIRYDAPNWFLNTLSIRALNQFYYQKNKNKKKLQDYLSFFYPLDAIHNWNKLYGRRGFFQYQCVIPQAVVQSLLRTIKNSKLSCSLAVLKLFGEKRSPGLMSFPKPGITLALDFPNQGQKTLSLFNRLDEMVTECGGSVYLAKDSRMSQKTFSIYYPQASLLEKIKDPHFSSNLWRRLTLLN